MQIFDKQYQWFFAVYNVQLCHQFEEWKLQIGQKVFNVYCVDICFTA